MAKMLINGARVDAGDGRTIDVFNPVDNSLVGTVPMATPEDIDRALEASKSGFHKWKAVPLREKEKIFNRFYQLLEKNRRDILATLIKESGCSFRGCRRYLRATWSPPSG